MVSSPSTVFNSMSRRGAHGARPQKLPVISGSVPPELSGVLFRAGPGRLRSHGTDYDHLFDGDGFIQRFSIHNGEVRFRSAYVATPQFLREQAVGRPVYRSFGTNLPGGLFRNAFRFRLKNAANTTPLLVHGDLLALWEGGAPHRLDPETLEYRGHWTAEGALSDRTLVERIMRNGRPFSAHPKRVAGVHELYSFGLSPGLKQRLLLYRIDPESGHVRVRESLLPRLTFMHDFAVTASGTRVFFDVGVAFHLLPAFLGLIPPAASIREDPHADTIVRLFDSEDRQHTIPGPGGYVFHIPNGFDATGDTDSDLVVDTCWLERFPDADDFRDMINDRTPRHPFRPTLTRHTISRSKQGVESAAVSEYAFELPAINPAFSGMQHRYIWGIAEPPGRVSAAPMFGVAKVDTNQSHTLYRDYHPVVLGEPVFVADCGSEDGGYLLLLAFDPETEQGLLLVLRADTLDEVARLALPEPAPLGFHGLWVEGMV